jgi:opacity protein-like surface antigen
VDVERTSDQTEAYMLRKSILALAAVATLGTAALAPTKADAHWYGHGWYGYGGPYYSGYAWDYRRPYWGFYGPRYVYGGKYADWRKPFRYY